MIKEAPSSYSYDLTERDRELILEQCTLQHATSSEEIAGFTSAYAFAKKFAYTRDLHSLSTTEVESLVLLLGQIVDPVNNHGYRKVAVVFSSGDSGLPSELVPDFMSRWSTLFSKDGASPEQLYYEFEKCHPFQDGNGRVGDLLWKLAMKRSTGTWIEELPPDLFSKAHSPRRLYSSSFGEIE